jgi:hypothetical protein
MRLRQLPRGDFHHVFPARERVVPQVRNAPKTRDMANVGTGGAAVFVLNPVSVPGRCPDASIVPGPRPRDRLARHFRPSLEPTMVRLFSVIAVLSTLVLASTASANQATAARQQVGATRNGPVAKLIELERRKNEWLRQRFAR